VIKSLRLRLLIHTSLAVAFIVALLGTAVYYFTRRSLERDFNEALLNQARAVAATAELHHGKIIFDFDPEEMPQFVIKNHPDYFEAWINPTTIIRSPSLGDRDLPQPAAIGPITYKDLFLPNGAHGRVLGMSFPIAEEHDEAGLFIHDPDSQTIPLSVASETESLRRTLEQLLWLLVGLCSLAVVVSGAALVLVVSRAVRPIERITRDIDALRESNLSARLAVPDIPSELRPVVEKLNGLLTRLETAFARERSFTADVAHELRTPLAALVTTFDVCRTRQRDEPAYIAAIDKSRQVAQRMQGMIEALLMVARADAGQLAVKLQSVDAADLIDDCWAMFAYQADARGLVVNINVQRPALLETDPEKVRIILHNLFDNAVAYANDAGTVRISAELSEGRFCLEVANTGSQISQEQVPRVFDRFWRGDESRVNTGVHSGLGLSLSQRLARLLNGEIEIHSAKMDWFTARLTLPVGMPTGQSAMAGAISA